MARQAVVDQREQVARLEDFDEVAHVVERPGGADLTGEPPARLVVGLGRGERMLDAIGDAVLKVAGQPLARRSIIIGNEGAADLVREGRGLRRQQVAEIQAQIGSSDARAMRP